LYHTVRWIDVTATTTSIRMNRAALFLRALGEARSAEFLAGVRRRLESLGWPRLTVTFVAYLTVGQRR